MSSISFDVFTLELKLDAVGTPYRTISIPSFYTMDKLHSMIIWLFQWSDEHQHKFKVNINDNNREYDDIDDDMDDKDSSSSLIPNDNDTDNDNKGNKPSNNKKSNTSYYWVSNLSSFPSPSHYDNNDNIKIKLESRVMLQNALHHKNDSIVYKYDFDSKINSNWTVFITLLSTKSIRNFPISDFDPFEFVEIIDGNGRTIPEYGIIDGIIDYDSNNNEINAGYLSPSYASDYDREYEQELREYNPKRLSEELQIMRSKYTMFYEDYKKNKKKKQKMKKKMNKKKNKNKNKKKKKKTKKRKKRKKRDDDDDEKVVDIIHDDDITDNHDSDDGDHGDDDNDNDDDDDDSSCYSSSSSSDENDEDDDDDDDFLSTTESDMIYKRDDDRYQQRNDYDHILHYSNNKKIKRNRKRKQYICGGIIILFCIIAWILSKLLFF